MVDLGKGEMRDGWMHPGAGCEDEDPGLDTATVVGAAQSCFPVPQHRPGALLPLLQHAACRGRVTSDQLPAVNGQSIH